MTNLEKKFESVFIAKDGEPGLTLTSSQQLCAIATHIKEDSEALFENLSFVNVEKTLISCEAYKRTGAGKVLEDLDTLAEAAEDMGRLNGFIAYCNEARKYIGDLQRRVANYRFDQWVEDFGIEKPEHPREAYYSDSSREEALEELSQTDRAMLLMLEAKSAALGMLIHPNGAITSARKEALKANEAPYEHRENGRDTILVHKSPSLDIDELNKFYHSLQKEYRDIQKNYNRQSGLINLSVDARNEEAHQKNLQASRDYNDALKVYQAAMKELENKFQIYKDELVHRAKSLKISLPPFLNEIRTWLEKQ